MTEVSDDQVLQNVFQNVRKLVKEEQIMEGLKCPTTDEFLLRFIKASRYDVNLSFQLIQRYFKYKLEDPECFVVQSPSKYLKMIQRTDITVVLKDVDKHGRRMFHLKFGNLDAGVEDFISIVQSHMMMYETCSFEEVVQDNGAAFIVNCENFSLNIMKWATPKKIKVMVAFLQDCIPIRFEIIHIVNNPHIFKVFYAALSPFLYEEVKKKIVWHSDLASLHEYIDRESLPIELGGSSEDSEKKEFYKDILEKEEVLAELRQMGYKN